jgi:ABC-type multidrug transport system fused ATPase/permease subunit
MAMISLIVFYIGFGLMMWVTQTLLDSLRTSNVICGPTHDCSQLYAASNGTYWSFKAFPFYNLAYGVQKIQSNSNITNSLLTFEEGGIMTNITFMAGCTFVYVGLAVLGEYGIMEWLVSLARTADAQNESRETALLPGEDADVGRERQRVQQLRGDSSGDLLVIDSLVKTYAPFCRPVKKAVQGVTVGIPRKEVFGLLGHNGAGKTTTFQIMSGDNYPTSGDVLINGRSVKTNMDEVILPGIVYFNSSRDVCTSNPL